jgi:hypothetical protein
LYVKILMYAMIGCILLVNVFLNLGWLLYTYTAPQRVFIPCRRKRPMRWEKGGRGVGAQGADSPLPFL